MTEATPLQDAFRAATRALGSSTARQIVKQIAGVNSLPDVPANKTTALIAALQTATNGGTTQASAARRPSGAGFRRASGLDRDAADTFHNPTVPDRDVAFSDGRGGIDTKAVYEKWNNPVMPGDDD